MDIDRDLGDLIVRVIKKEIRWLRHYSGQVVDNADTLNKGRVKVVIPELGFDTADLGMWCFPRQGDSLNVPLLDDWVEVYFRTGDPNQPVYLHYMSEAQDALSSYDGDTNNRILFESPTTGEYIKYNDEEKKIEINMTEASITLLGNFNVSIEGDTSLDVKGKIDITSATAINMLGANQSFVKGDELKTQLQLNIDALTQLQLDFTSWSPTANDGGAALKAVLQAGFLLNTLASLTNILSTLIKGE